MSRHTLSDGVTLDLRIRPGSFHLHLPIFAPSLRLIGDYKKRKNISWEEFAERYVQEIRAPRTSRYVRALAYIARFFPITLLCIEGEHVECHRGLLAKECQRYVPTLKIEHR